VLIPRERRDNFHFVVSNGVSIPIRAETVHLAYSEQVLKHLHPDDSHDHLREKSSFFAPLASP
jgi:hypothetical protein